MGSQTRCPPTRRSGLDLSSRQLQSLVWGVSVRGWGGGKCPNSMREQGSVGAVAWLTSQRKGLTPPAVRWSSRAGHAAPAVAQLGSSSHGALKA